MAGETLLTGDMVVHTAYDSCHGIGIIVQITRWSEGKDIYDVFWPNSPEIKNKRFDTHWEWHLSKVSE